MTLTLASLTEPLALASGENTRKLELRYPRLAPTAHKVSAIELTPSARLGEAQSEDQKNETKRRCRK